MTAPLTFGGLPVPWNAMWSGETQQCQVRPCRWVDGRLAVWSPHRPGVGRPIFAKPHFVRQRQSVTRLLCTVCGEHTPPADRWWFGHGQMTDRHFMTMESPVHRACAELALSVCPHLKGREADLARFPEGSRVAASILGGDEFERDFGIRTMGRTIIGALKFAWPESAVAFQSTPLPPLTKPSVPGQAGENR